MIDAFQGWMHASFRSATVPTHKFTVFKPISTKNIKRTSNRNVHSPPAQAGQLFEFSHVRNPSSISQRLLTPLPEQSHQFAVKSLTKPFHIRRMD